MSGATSEIGEAGGNGKAGGNSKSGESGGDGTVRYGAGDHLVVALRTLRARPVLFVPFVIAGLIVTAVDWFRLRGPVPVERVAELGDGTITIAYAVYPSGRGATTVPPDALVGLKSAYLLWLFATAAVGVLAVSLAGCVTIARTEGRALAPRAILNYAAYVGLAALAPFTVDGLIDISGALSLVVFLAWVFVVVWTFPVPAFVVRGDGVGEALRRSWRATTGHGLTIVGLAIALGLAVHVFASAGLVGAFLSYALVAPVHAVAVVSFLEPGRVREGAVAEAGTSA